MNFTPYQTKLFLTPLPFLRFVWCLGTFPASDKMIYTHFLVCTHVQLSRTTINHTSVEWNAVDWEYYIKIWKLAQLFTIHACKTKKKLILWTKNPRGYDCWLYANYFPALSNQFIHPFFDLSNRWFSFLFTAKNLMWWVFG